MIRTFLLTLILLAAQPVFSDETKPKSIQDSISVKVVGILQMGIVAIGGETTGVTIKSKGATFELDFGSNAEFRKEAEILNGKTTIVQGSLERRAGVEVPERWIVTVTAIRSAKPESRK